MESASEFIERTSSVDVKKEKPIYPTFSRGKTARIVYTKNHCYSTVHQTPVQEVYDYLPKGLGIGDLPYTPLTHIVDRTKPKSPKVYYPEADQVKKTFEHSIDYLKQKRRLHEKFREMLDVKEAQLEETRITYNNFRRKMREQVEELNAKSKSMHNELRYKHHIVNNLLHDYNDYITKVNLK